MTNCYICGSDKTSLNYGKPQWIANKETPGTFICKSCSTKRQFKNKPKSTEHKRKIGLGNTGKSASPETRELMSKQRKGKPGHPSTPEINAKISSTKKKFFAEHPEEAQKISDRLTGRTLSTSTKEKISMKNPMKNPETVAKLRKTLKEQFANGERVPWNKDLTAEIDERLKKITGENNGMYGRKGDKHPSYGKPRPDTTERLKKRVGPLNPMYGTHLDDDEKENLRQFRNKQVFPKQDTKLEKTYQQAFTLAGIPFETHKAIAAQPDIFIESALMCFMLDGGFYHADPREWPADFIIIGDRTAKWIRERDAKQTIKMQLLGYRVKRFWERELLERPVECFQEMVGLIRDKVTIDGAKLAEALAWLDTQKRKYYPKHFISNKGRD